MITVRNCQGIIDTGFDCTYCIKTTVIPVGTLFPVNDELDPRVHVGMLQTVPVDYQ
jgi:hypothetical protein